MWDKSGPQNAGMILNPPNAPHGPTSTPHGAY